MSTVMNWLMLLLESEASLSTSLLAFADTYIVSF